MTEHHLPADIERSSMNIIRAELQKLNISLPPEQTDVILRCIHATADFDYASSLVFSDNAVSLAVDALRSGCGIVTDTNMTLAGLSRPCLERFGISARCFMADPEIAVLAKRNNCTRAVAAMDYAAEHFPDAIRAIGNAPTALFRLSEQLAAGLRPALIIAVPVGFVNVVESKERIVRVCRETGIPCIAAMGRKGGSTVAAAVCNALLYRASDQVDPSARGWN